VNLADLTIGPVPWVKKPKDSAKPESRVVCTVFNLYRNLSFFPFLPAASSSQKKEIREKLTDLFGRGDMKYSFLLTKISPDEKQMLAERLILTAILSGTLANKEKETSLAESCLVLAEEGKTTALINVREHLKLSAYIPGFTVIPSGEKKINDLLNVLSHETWAFDPEFGYLNSDPLNAGSGFRVAAFVHFPGVYFSRQQEQLIKSIHAMGMAGFGQGDLTGKGGFLWIGSKGSLGRSEDEIFMDFTEKLNKYLKLEDELAQSMYEKDKSRIEDSVFRSFYQLLGARILSFAEFLELSSWVRLGAYFQLIKHELLELLDILQVKTNSAHLRLTESSPLTENEYSVVRAAMVRLTLMKYRDEIQNDG
jgi:protein arginine kinase